MPNRFPCLDGNSYHGCVGMRCPYFDYRGTAPGCVFHPVVNTKLRLASEASERRARIKARKEREAEVQSQSQDGAA